MEAPLSRVEAILQNILGADNVLVPPGSQVEEILQAIYYNTEYEKNPESRVAEILLAIKNKGIYDGPVLSRVEDILIHKLNNIPYTKHKKEDLSRVEQLLLDWLEQGGGEEIIEYTGTFPMTILANGEPLLDYIISGNTVQSGTPSPDNPIMPQGTGERTGNLINIYANNTSNGYVDNVLLRSDGSTYSPSSAYISEYLPIEDNKTYTYYTGGRTGVAQAVCFYNAAKEYISGISYDNQTAITFTTPQGTKYYRCTVMRTASDTESYKKAMLNSGSTALPYEPYGYKLDISSANTTTPVYLGEVKTTRAIRKYVFNGTEGWQRTSNGAYYLPSVSNPMSNYKYISADISINSHFASQGTVSASSFVNDGKSAFFYIASSGTREYYIAARNIPTADDFKAYLAAQYAAGTPVCVWYTLATPKTAVVNEPLMKIGGYADSISKEQAGEDVPTNEKPTETVIDVPTSVKPSEGYIKYTEPTDGPTPKTQVLGTKNHEIYMTSNDEVYVLRR